eukprot:COSAG02_NODE_8617_length_2503_cov_6.137271_2_plen_118_part_00
MHGRATVLAALPQPRHAPSAVADLAASHRALIAPTLPIEGARMHAHAISMGAVAVFVRFTAPSRPLAAVFAALRSPCLALAQRIMCRIWLWKHCTWIHINLFVERGADFCRRLGSLA